MLILPPEKKRKIGSKEPENRRPLSFATPSKYEIIFCFWYKNAHCVIVSGMRIAIIGAGFSGLSVAWNLMMRIPCEITFFEKKGIGGGASGIAAGLIHPYVGKQCRRSAFAIEGIQATKELIAVAEEKLGEKIVQQGIIRFVQNEEQRQMLLSHCQTFGDIRMHHENSFWIDSGMTIDCPRYLKGLWKALCEKGVKLILKEVLDLSSLKDFDHIVIAAGAGVMRFSEGEALNLSILKGQILKCHVPEKVMLPDASLICTGYVALAEERKSCFIGSTYQRGDMSENPQPELVKKELFAKIACFFPSVFELAVTECRAAFRVARKGHYLPIATRLKEKIWILTAMGSRGLLYHAYFGRTIAEEIVNF
jgi:glycine/D-amino acid oxidase-like deaminating enzyme